MYCTYPVAIPLMTNRVNVNTDHPFGYTIHNVAYYEQKSLLSYDKLGTQP